MSQSRLEALEVIERNPVTREELVTMDLDAIPDGVCVSCWAWHSLRGIDALPHTTCTDLLAGKS